MWIRYVLSQLGLGRAGTKVRAGTVRPVNVRGHSARALVPRQVLAPSGSVILCVCVYIYISGTTQFVQYILAFWPPYLQAEAKDKRS